MKTLKLVFTAMLLVSLFFTACNKKSEEILSMSVEEAESKSNEIVEMEAIFETIDYTVEENLGTILNNPPPPGDCPTVTKDQPKGVFPVTITLDFGESCLTPNGKIKSGIIFITLTAKPMTPGATRTVTFENFFVEGKGIEGVRNWTNNGLNDEGQPSWTRTTVGAHVTWPDGQVKSWDANHTVLKTAGFTTPHFKKDDEFEITGNRTVVRKDGSTYISSITTPLVRKNICHWIVSGMRDITKDGNTVTLDYGNGDCDKWGTITLADGTSKQIKLKPWKHH